ncbi:hypothetical protein BMR10_15560, partial [Methylococcaceae bacterium CS4]
MIKPLSNIILNFILSVFWLWCSVAIYFILLPYVDWAVFISVAFVCVIPPLKILETELKRSED